MTDSIYLMYYNGKFIGLLNDSDAFYYLDDYMSGGEDPFNVVVVDKSFLSLPDNLESFERLIQHYGGVELHYAKINLGIEYDDSLA